MPSNCETAWDTALFWLDVGAKLSFAGFALLAIALCYTVYVKARGLAPRPPGLSGHRSTDAAVATPHVTRLRRMHTGALLVFAAALAAAGIPYGIARWLCGA